MFEARAYVRYLVSLPLNVPLRRECCPEFFFASHFSGAHLAASAGVFKASLLVIGFRDDLGNVDALTGVIDCYEGQIGRGDMPQGVGADVFHHALHPDFHGGVEGAIDAGLENENVSDLDRGDEVEMVHGSGDRNGSGMAAGGHGTDQIDKLHQPSAEEVAEGIGIAGEDNLAALGLGECNGASMGKIRVRVRSPALRHFAHILYSIEMDRIAMLNEILQQNPNDAFARYGLAMAYAGEGKHDDALREYATTIANTPDYVPAYQMSAQILVKLGRLDEARERLAAGLAAAERTGNAHAASEMQGMVDEL